MTGAILMASGRVADAAGLFFLFIQSHSRQKTVGIVTQKPSKRIFDIGLSAVTLLAMSPFLGLIGVAVRLTSPGPALFASERSGINGNLFKMNQIPHNGLPMPSVLAHRSQRRMIRALRRSAGF